MKSQYITLIAIVAAVLFLFFCRRLDLLLLIVPVSVAWAWLAARENISGQHRI